MKRPFAVIGFSVILCLTAASYWNAAVAGVMALFLAACAAAALPLLHGKTRLAAVVALAAGAAALGAYAGVMHWRVEPLERFDGRTVELSGTVTDLPTRSGDSTVCILRVAAADGSTRTALHGAKIRLTLSGSADAFDTVTVQAKLAVPTSGGGFDSRRYYRSKGIYLTAKASSTPTVQAPARRPLYGYAVAVRQYVSGVMARVVTGQWGALAAGILIGDVSQLSARVKSDFTATGISHLLAVSGTQTSLIMQVLLMGLGALRIRRRPAAAVTAGAIVGFLAVTGFSPSVMRAGVMSLVYLAGLLIGREADALNSLGFAVLALCAVNPFAASDVGLQLSAAATLGMITLSSPMAARVKRALTPLPAVPRRLLAPFAGVLCETAGASLLTFPVILLVFRRLALVTPLSNLLEVPAATLVTLAAALAALIAPVPFLGFLLTALGMFLRILTAGMMAWAHLLAGIPFATVSTAYGFVGILFGFMVLAAAATWLCRGRGGNWRVLTVCVALAAAVGVLSHLAAADGVLTLAAVPVTAGSSAVLVRQGRAVVFELYGSGADYAVEQYLKARNVQHIDALILPGYDKNRVERANGLMDDMPIGRVFVPGAYTSEENRRTTAVASPTEIDWQGVRITLLPGEQGKFLLARAVYGSSTALLLGHTADDTAGYGTASALKSEVLFWGGPLGEPLAQAVSPALVLRSAAAQDAGGLTKLVGLSSRIGVPARDGVSEVLTRGNGRYLWESDGSGGLS